MMRDTVMGGLGGITEIKVRKLAVGPGSAADCCILFGQVP